MEFSINLLLAEDDESDRMVFTEAINELALPVNLKMVNNGTQLLNWLSSEENLIPDMLFLDLNMPQKNGFACLAKIRLMEKVNQVPVVIYSHSFDPEVANLLHRLGAHYYIRKPANFEVLKKVIHQSILQITTGDKSQPTMDKFILHAN